MSDITALTAHIVASAAENEASRMRFEELVDLIRSVKRALKEEGGAKTSPGEKTNAAKTMSKAQWSKLLTAGRIKSMIDGKSYASLKRQLKAHGYDPESYRSTFGLPDDFPMVSPEYSAMRSDLAKTRGLGGSKTGSRAQPTSKPESAVEAGKSHRKASTGSSPKTRAKKNGQ